MKKIVLIFVAVMMMAFSSVCMADDGGDLNKDQKVPYDKLGANIDNGLKKNFDAKAYDALKNEIQTKFGDLKESKFYSFERHNNQDKVIYLTSFSQENVVAIVFIFDKNNKLVEFGLLPIQQNQQAQESAQQ